MKKLAATFAVLMLAGAAHAATISYTVDTLSFAGNGVYNDCEGAATVSFLVPAGSTFSATAATVSGSGGTPAITTWAESPNGQ